MADKQATLAELEARFRAMGAREPATWAQSELDGEPALARFLFLRQIWRSAVETDGSWIGREIARAAKRPDLPGATVGAALARLRALGATDADLTTVVRAAQTNVIFSIAGLVNDPAFDDESDDDISWVLVQVGPNGEPLRQVDGLQDFVFATEPVRD
jgi:hypothetical protein